MGRSVFVCLLLKCGVCNVLFDFGLVHRINFGSFSGGLKDFGGWGLGVGCMTLMRQVLFYALN